MFGPRLNRIFASRWSALWWAGCIVLLAWRVAGPDGLVAPDSTQPLPTAASNPWAVDPK